MLTPRPLSALLAVVALGLSNARPVHATDPKSSGKVAYRTVKIDGLDIFYREAGPTDARRSCSCTASRRRRTCSAT